MQGRTKVRPYMKSLLGPWRLRLVMRGGVAEPRRVGASLLATVWLPQSRASSLPLQAWARQDLLTPGLKSLPVG